MGLVSILQLAIGAVSTIAQVSAQNRAEAARKEQRAISGASEEVKNRIARRQQAKRLRVMRARIASGAEAGGVGGSSGELGALGAASSSTGASVAQQQMEILTNRGLSAQMQKEADAISSGKKAAAWGGLLNEAVQLGKDENIFG